MRSRPRPDPVGPGQESVWDYPRPPRLEATTRRLRVVLDGVTVAETTRGHRTLETSHPPTYYLPPDDCALECFEPAPGTSLCEWKGRAEYFTVRAGGLVAERAAWAYPEPTAAFTPIAGHFAFYPFAFECWVDDERVQPQPGRFYGGWVTSDLAGPFKGEPGSEWW